MLAKKVKILKYHILVEFFIKPDIHKIVKQVMYIINIYSSNCRINLFEYVLYHNVYNNYHFVIRFIVYEYALNVVNTTQISENSHIL